MKDYMYKARDREAWIAFGVVHSVYDEDLRLQWPFAVDELGLQGDEAFPFLVNVRVLEEIPTPKARELADLTSADCRWVPPDSVTTPLRTFAGGMQYYSPDPLPKTRKK